MCVDFTKLYKSYSKDSFLLSHIDLIVDSTAGHLVFSLMDTYLEYNQIQMNPGEEEKNSFVTDCGLIVIEPCRSH